MKRSTVPVKLIRIKDETLESRAQAQELISLFRDSKEIVLDFNDIKAIGEDFADEIFRVYKYDHPDVVLSFLDTSDQIEQAILGIQTNG